MYRPRLRTALLAVGTLLVTSAAVVGDDYCGGCGPAPCGPAMTYQTVTCVEYVQEQVPVIPTLPLLAGSDFSQRIAASESATT